MGKKKKNKKAKHGLRELVGASDTGAGRDGHASRR